MREIIEIQERKENFQRGGENWERNRVVEEEEEEGESVGREKSESVGIPPASWRNSAG